MIPLVIPKTEGCRQVNREVNLTKRVKTAQGLRFSPVVISAKGSVKPGYVGVDGKEQRHPEAPITWNGAMAANASGSPSERTPASPPHGGTVSNRF
jgi:hypothetical protein